MAIFKQDLLRIDHPESGFPLHRGQFSRTFSSFSPMFRRFFFIPQKVFERLNLIDCWFLKGDTCYCGNIFAWLNREMSVERKRLPNKAINLLWNRFVSGWEMYFWTTVPQYDLYLQNSTNILFFEALHKPDIIICLLTSSSFHREWLWDRLKIGTMLEYIHTYVIYI